MKRSIQHYIEREQLLTPHAPVILALSGGADSVALLHILHALGYTCIAAHCNFHLRSEESDRDEQFVRQLCQQYNITLHVQHFDTTAHATAHKISIEMAARELRYTWFEQLRLEHHAQAIAVAHHADDQVETLLLNLARGTGLRGLCAMHPRNGHIVRPLLTATRADIEHYLRIKQQDYVTDSTNAQTIYRRNRVRHQLIPLFEELNPQFGQTCAQTTHQLAGYTHMIDALVAQARTEMTHTEGDALHIDLDKLHTQPAPETLLYELLAPYAFAPQVVGQIYAATHGISGKLFHASEYTALKDRNTLIVYPRTAENTDEYDISVNIRPISTPLSYPEATALTALFDAHTLPPTYTIRPWREGDRFAPLGMNGRQKKLSDFFADQKLTLREKQQIRVLAHHDQIIWIIGHRIADPYKITSTTTQICEITVTINSSANF